MSTVKLILIHGILKSYLQHPKVSLHLLDAVSWLGKIVRGFESEIQVQHATELLNK